MGSCAYDDDDDDGEVDDNGDDQLMMIQFLAKMIEIRRW
jgi:hypothetical protein